MPAFVQRRGFCPSCLGRRMADTAAFCVDHLFPRVPARQYVLSLPYRGCRVLRLRGAGEDAEAAIIGKRCADVAGFNVHANVRARANDRDGLEHLCRYLARPPIANDRLQELPDGRALGLPPKPDDFHYPRHAHICLFTPPIGRTSECATGTIHPSRGYGSAHIGGNPHWLMLMPHGSTQAGRVSIWGEGNVRPTTPLNKQLQVPEPEKSQVTT